MDHDNELGEMIPHTITRYRNHSLKEEQTHVAAEVPLTFEVNDREIATLMCTPSHLKAFACGFLFTSGFIKAADDILGMDLDRKKWRMEIRVRDLMDPDLLGKRVYTSGCGKGVMYTSMMELSGRHPIESSVRIPGEDIIRTMGWLQKCSTLHNTTGGVHSAAVSVNGALPGFHIDDIGRHNAVDKIIGTLLMEGTDCSNIVLATTGRISSEILHKARRLDIPILASRGAPTHQSVLLAEEMGITIAGFVRRTNFAVFTHARRILAR
ncbi:formate dehydrogenase accessory sulfurtransferase FdhD [Desulfospira joergensenii]|uniref:formate dehydrogenase accessory sulfurtransferase FdhD n=1 Tax=Desulfospira joergensenii TaxID=53329 RepID=UPI0003B47B0B|nr:formate dehydrogenase accessory sulfurtransferase FdhD [Desulfospira joergensenii]